VKHPYVHSLYEWIATGVPLHVIGYPYAVVRGENEINAMSSNWRFIASGTKDEMDALEKLMLASINRELINEIHHTGETDGE
jgi:hypothetical protein